MKSAVILKDVAHTFGSGPNAVQALRGVNLEIREGEHMMIVGPSGCGKTTLLCVIAGLLERHSGYCEVYGHDCEIMSDSERSHCRGREIGFVFQAYNVIPSLTAVENTMIPLLINGYRGADKKARDLLAAVGLEARMDAKPPELSGGELQRVAICRALVHNPRLIVCDEPTSALDSKTGAQVMEVLNEHATGEGKSLIVVTHDTRIFSYADRIAKMDDGRIVGVYNSIEEMESEV